MRRLAPILLLIVVSCGAPAREAADTSSTPAATAAPRGAQGRLDRVADGDSLWIVLDGISTEVRLLGINAPEEEECWAEQSSLDLETATRDRLLTVVGDEQDQFGRLLAYVYDGAFNVNLAMIGDGNALALATEHDLLPEFLASEEDAVDLERGLWAPGACGERVIDRGVSIWAIEPNAPGRDDIDPNGEWVAIGNEGPAADLTGWMIRDESSTHRFRFPDGFVLEQGRIVTVRSGCGDDTTSDLFWCAATPVWTNSGDTVLLLEPSGAVNERIRYLQD